MTSIFRGRRSTFETSMFICVAGAALSTCRAACFLRIALSAASIGDNVQIAWQAWDMAGAAFGEDPSCVECHFVWQAVVTW